MTTQSIYHALMRQPPEASGLVSVPRQPVAEYVQKQRSLLGKKAEQIQIDRMEELRRRQAQEEEERRRAEEEEEPEDEQDSTMSTQQQQRTKRKKRYDIEFKKAKRERRRLFFEGKKMERIVKHNESMGGSPDGSVWSVRYLKRGVLAEMEERGQVVNVTRSKVETLLHKAREKGKASEVDSLGLDASGVKATGDKLDLSQHVWVTRDKWDKLIAVAGPLEPSKKHQLVPSKKHKAQRR
ncbi:hypothetical protein ACM66B_004784 [Microbotryomycetes sp. NB124-2]